MPWKLSSVTVASTPTLPGATSGDGTLLFSQRCVAPSQTAIVPPMPWITVVVPPAEGVELFRTLELTKAGPSLPTQPDVPDRVTGPSSAMRPFGSTVTVSCRSVDRCGAADAGAAGAASSNSAAPAERARAGRLDMGDLL